MARIQLEGVRSLMVLSNDGVIQITDSSGTVVTVPLDKFVIKSLVTQLTDWK